MKNSKIIAKFLAVFIFVLMASASVSALSLIAQFDNGKTTKAVMPGSDAGYNVLVTADQNLTRMNVTGNLYDVTTNETIFLGQLFNISTSRTFYYSDGLNVNVRDYTTLPGKYRIEIFAEEVLTFGYYTSDMKEIELTVIGNRPPVANFIYYPSTNITTGMPVHFNSTSYDPDGFIVRYEWFVGTTKIAESVNTRYTFNRPGTYEVTLRVTDNNGATDSHTETLIVTQGPITGYPVANFTNSTNLCEDEYVMFTSSSYDSDGNIVLEEWDLNDDGTYEQRGHSVSRLFQQEGSFTVWLKVTDDRGLTTSISKIFNIVECGTPAGIPPVANFTYTPQNPVEDETITFVSNSYDPDGWIVRQQWDFNNDGIFDRTGSTTSWTYPESGAYIVTLRVTDNDGLTGTTAKIIVVGEAEEENIPPVADFIYAPVNPDSETSISFLSTSYDPDGTIVREDWYVDGSFTATSHQMNIVLSEGTHTVTLTVYDNDDATDSETKTIVVTQAEEENIPPVADFIYEPSNITVFDKVEFESTSYDPDGEIVRQYWYVEGNLIETDEEMETSFASPGIYEVTLVVFDDDGASDSETKFIFVTAANQNIPPVANFTYSPLRPEVNDVVVFESTSYDPDGIIIQYEWLIDGALFATTEDATYQFATAGTYAITLRVTDDDGASDQMTQYVTVSVPDCSPTAVLTAPQSVYVGENVQMNAVLSTAKCGQTIIAYRWEVLCPYSYSVFTTTTPYFNFTFPNPGSCRVVLTVFTDGGLWDSTEKTIFAGIIPSGINQGDEDGLYVEYFEVIGCDYGVIRCGDIFTVSAIVSNDRDDDIKNLRITFSIPELGYKVESEKFTLREGQTRTISLTGSLDFNMGDVPPGEYVALIGISDSDTVRVKYSTVLIE